MEGQWIYGFHGLLLAAGFILGPVTGGLDGRLWTAVGLNGRPVSPAASRLSAHTGLLAPSTVPLPRPSALYLSKPRVSHCPKCFRCPLLFDLWPKPSACFFICLHVCAHLPMLCPDPRKRFRCIIIKIFTKDFFWLWELQVVFPVKPPWTRKGCSQHCAFNPTISLLTHFLFKVWPPVC